MAEDSWAPSRMCDEEKMCAPRTEAVVGTRIWEKCSSSTAVPATGSSAPAVICLWTPRQRPAEAEGPRASPGSPLLVPGVGALVRLDHNMVGWSLREQGWVGRRHGLHGGRREARDGWDPSPWKSWGESGCPPPGAQNLAL